MSFGGTLADVNSSLTTAYLYTDRDITSAPTVAGTTATANGLNNAWAEHYGSLTASPLTYHTISGLDWTVPTGDSNAYYTFVLTLVTQDAPAWGDFIAEGLATSTAYTSAWNLGLATNDTPEAIVPGSYLGYEYVLTPGAPVPIPPSVLLLAGGLGGLVLTRRRKNK